MAQQMQKIGNDCFSVFPFFSTKGDEGGGEDFFHQTVPGKVLDVVSTVHRIPFVLLGHVSGGKVPGTGCEPFGVLRHVVVALFAPCCQQRRRPRRCSELRFGYYQACSMVLEAFDGFLHGRAAWQFHGFCYGCG